VFEGVESEDIGSRGAILGAAAAYEFDRADEQLGTPRDAVRLASARGFGAPYQLVVEDREEGANGADSSDLMRADMVIFGRSTGGCVFATGSAAWNASLDLGERSETPTARITRNVLRRFIDTPDGVSPLGSATEGGLG
jgi:N,N-dimethylformamidase